MRWTKDLGLMVQGEGSLLRGNEGDCESPCVYVMPVSFRGVMPASHLWIFVRTVSSED